MNVIVLVKQVFNTEAKIQLDGNGQIESNGTEKIVNPYDELAIEEAIKIKEKTGGKVTVITYGTSESTEAIRQAFAMGADEGILVLDESQDNKNDSSVVANALATVIKQQEYDLIMGGQIAIDDAAAQVCSRLAEVLELPQINVVTKLEVDGDTLTATRDIDGGWEVVECQLPAVITAQRGLNDPRYPSIKSIMKAKKMKISQYPIADLQLTKEAAVKIHGYSLPESRAAGEVKEGTPQELATTVAKFLSQKAQVI